MQGRSRVTLNSRHKGPVTRKMFPFDDVIMATEFWPHVDFCIRPDFHMEGDTYLVTRHSIIGLIVCWTPRNMISLMRQIYLDLKILCRELHQHASQRIAGGDVKDSMIVSSPPTSGNTNLPMRSQFPYACACLIWKIYVSIYLDTYKYTRDTQHVLYIINVFFQSVYQPKTKG